MIREKTGQRAQVAFALRDDRNLPKMPFIRPVPFIVDGNHTILPFDTYTFGGNVLVIHQ